MVGYGGTGSTQRGSLDEKQLRDALGVMGEHLDPNSLVRKYFVKEGPLPATYGDLPEELRRILEHAVAREVLGREGATREAYEEFVRSR